MPMKMVMYGFCRVQADGGGNSGLVLPKSCRADSTRAETGFHSAMFFSTSGMVWMGTKALEMNVSGKRIMKDALLITSGLRTLIPAPGAYETYVHQLSVLLPPKRRKIYTPRQWVPWLPGAGVRRGCPDCLESSPAVLLFWQLPVMASCPVHGRRLETYEGHPADYLLWTTPAQDQRALPEPLSLMDRRTWQAITTGSVDLPRYPVHAGIWFRLLRTLLDELTTAQGRHGRQLDDVRRVWEHCGHPFRAGLYSWQPFETLHWTAQQQPSRWN